MNDLSIEYFYKKFEFRAGRINLISDFFFCMGRTTSSNSNDSTPRNSNRSGSGNNSSTSTSTSAMILYYHLS